MMQQYASLEIECWYVSTLIWACVVFTYYMYEYEFISLVISTLFTQHAVINNQPFHSGGEWQEDNNLTTTTTTNVVQCVLDDHSLIWFSLDSYHISIVNLNNHMHYLTRLKFNVIMK